MIHEVLVPFTQGKLATTAQEIATALAGEVDGSVRLLVGSGPARDGQIIAAQEVADSLSSASGRRVGVTVLTPQGFFHDEIVDEAERSPDATLVLPVPTGGRRSLVLGSMSMDVLTYLDRAVVLVGPECVETPLVHDGPIVVALDGTPEAEEIVGSAVDLGVVMGRELDIVTVLNSADTMERELVASGDVQESSYVRNVARAATVDDEHQPTFEVRHGEPAAEIVQTAIDRKAPLIAMTSHVPLGFDRLLHGSVLDQVVAHSTVPVLAMHKTPRGQANDG